MVSGTCFSLARSFVLVEADVSGDKSEDDETDDERDDKNSDSDMFEEEDEGDDGTDMVGPRPDLAALDTVSLVDTEVGADMLETFQKALEVCFMCNCHFGVWGHTILDLVWVRVWVWVRVRLRVWVWVWVRVRLRVRVWVWVRFGFGDGFGDVFNDGFGDGFGFKCVCVSCQTDRVVCRYPILGMSLERRSTFVLIMRHSVRLVTSSGSYLVTIQ